MSMMARVVRSESLVAGWIYLLVNSVVMGGIFGLVLGERREDRRQALVELSSGSFSGFSGR